MFANFKLSHRGAIRRPPSIVTWIYSLNELAARYKISDTGAVVRMWNSMVARANQLTGGKAQSVNNVMEFDARG